MLYDVGNVCFAHHYRAKVTTLTSPRNSQTISGGPELIAPLKWESEVCQPLPRAEENH